MTQVFSYPLQHRSPPKLWIYGCSEQPNKHNVISLLHCNWMCGLHIVKSELIYLFMENILIQQICENNYKLALVFKNPIKNFLWKSAYLWWVKLNFRLDHLFTNLLFSQINKESVSKIRVNSEKCQVWIPVSEVLKQLIWFKQYSKTPKYNRNWQQ